MGGGLRRVGRGIWIVSVTCEERDRDSIEDWWADAFFLAFRDSADYT